MEMNDKELKCLYQSYVETLTRDSRSSCPSYEDFLNALDPSSSRKAKDAFVEHLSHCAHCAREFQLAREVFKKQNSMISDHALSRANYFVHIRTVISSAFQKHLRKLAPALLMTGLAVFCAIISPPLSRLIDGHGRSICIPVRLRPLESSYLGNSLKFKWSKLPEAHYVLEIYNESLELLWESPKLFTREYILPRHIQGKLHPGEKYYWAVTAISINGTREESGFQAFTPCK